MVPLLLDVPKLGIRKPLWRPNLSTGGATYGKVKNWHTLQPEGCAVNLGGRAYTQHDPFGIERPFRARQFARCYRAVMQHIFVWPVLLHHLAGKSNGTGRGERNVSSPEAGAG